MIAEIQFWRNLSIQKTVILRTFETETSQESTQLNKEATYRCITYTTNERPLSGKSSEKTEKKLATDLIPEQDCLQLY